MSDPLEILYQDDWLVAVNKPAGYLVHPAREPQEGDLVAMKILRDQIGKRVHTIHRLDRPTSGVLLFGLEKASARKLHKALENHEMQKIYWAVVNGIAPAEEWECHEPILKNEGEPEREACTSFKVLATRDAEELEGVENSNLTLIEATPHTGRFHQIRRHLLHAGIPIVGDYRYSGIERCDQLGEKLGTGTRMLLQAKSLKIAHPISGNLLKLEAQVDELLKKCFPLLG